MATNPTIPVETVEHHPLDSQGRLAIGAEYIDETLTVAILGYGDGDENTVSELLQEPITHEAQVSEDGFLTVSEQFANKMVLFGYRNSTDQSQEDE